jgi:hypothetical protein
MPACLATVKEAEEAMVAARHVIIQLRCKAGQLTHSSLQKRAPKTQQRCAVAADTVILRVYSSPLLQHPP